MSLDVLKASLKQPKAPTVVRHVIDIIFIPSLHQDAISAEDHKFFDPKALPDSVDICFSKFCYTRDRDTFIKNQWDVLDVGHALLRALHDQLEYGRTRNRSLIFLCSSFGGFVVKRALLAAESEPTYRPIYDSVEGILFLGTISNLKAGELRATIVRCAAAEFSISESDSLFKSKQLSSFIKDAVQDSQRFENLHITFPIYDLFEQKETSVRKHIFTHSFILVPQHLVGRETSKAKEQVIEVAVGHVEMCAGPKAGSEVATAVYQILKDLFQELGHKHLLARQTKTLPTSWPAKQPPAMNNGLPSSDGSAANGPPFQTGSTDVHISKPVTFVKVSAGPDTAQGDAKISVVEHSKGDATGNVGASPAAVNDQAAIGNSGNAISPGRAPESISASVSQTPVADIGHIGAALLATVDLGTDTAAANYLGKNEPQLSSARDSWGNNSVVLPLSTDSNVAIKSQTENQGKREFEKPSGISNGACADSVSDPQTENVDQIVTDLPSNIGQIITSEIQNLPKTNDAEDIQVQKHEVVTKLKDHLSQEANGRFRQQGRSDTVQLSELLSLSKAKTPEPATVNLRLPCRMLSQYQKNENFVGRKSLLEDLSTELDPGVMPRSKQATYALVGLGGMGKTQTALAYVFRAWDSYEAILWASAADRAKLSQSFADFAYEMGLVDDPVADQGSCLIKIKHWFQSARVPWLVVFDNADSQDRVRLLEDFWPQGDYGSILITSRDKALIDTFARKGKELDLLDENDAVDLLYRASGRIEDATTRPDALKIVQGVDRLPLAVYQIAFFIRMGGGMTFKDYLVAYDNRTLLQDSDPVGGTALRYGYTLSNVWDVHLSKMDDKTKTLINIMSFLDPDKVHENLMLDGAKRSKDGRLRFISGEKNFVRCRTNLYRSGLIYRNEKLRILGMHRLVQDTCLLRMDASSRQHAFELAYTIVSQIWSVPEMHHRRRHDLWPEQEVLVPQVVRLSQCYEEWSGFNSEENEFESLVANKKFTELLYNAAWYYYERGLFTSAEPLLDLATWICENELDDPELILADIYGAYGGIDSERNQLQGTLDNFKKQHEYLLAAFDKGLLKRPNVREALALGGLAQGYAGLDEYPQAEHYYRECIKVWKDCPGEPTIYQSHLGTCLAFQGKLEEAEKVLVAVIEDRAERFGPRDTTSYRTALLYFALNLVRIRQGRFQEAYNVSKDCLTMYIATWGAGHHGTADAYYKVGWHLWHQGENTDAIKMYDEAVKIYNNDKEYENEIARTKYMMGIAYQEISRKDKSETLLKEAEALREKILGQDYVQARGEQDYDKL